jgi:hypothetical protein
MNTRQTIPRHDLEAAMALSAKQADRGGLSDEELEKVAGGATPTVSIVTFTASLVGTSAYYTVQEGW